MQYNTIESMYMAYQPIYWYMTEVYDLYMTAQYNTVQLKI